MKGAPPHEAESRVKSAPCEARPSRENCRRPNCVEEPLRGFTGAALSKRPASTGRSPSGRRRARPPRPRRKRTRRSGPSCPPERIERRTHPESSQRRTDAPPHSPKASRAPRPSGSGVSPSIHASSASRTAFQAFADGAGAQTSVGERGATASRAPADGTIFTDTSTRQSSVQPSTPPAHPGLAFAVARRQPPRRSDAPLPPLRASPAPSFRMPSFWPSTFPPTESRQLSPPPSPSAFLCPPLPARPRKLSPSLALSLLFPMPPLSSQSLSAARLASTRVL